MNDPDDLLILRRSLGRESLVARAELVAELEGDRLSVEVDGDDVALDGGDLDRAVLVGLVLARGGVVEPLGRDFGPAGNDTNIRPPVPCSAPVRLV
jgi:hypothetical protein